MTIKCRQFVSAKDVQRIRPDTEQETRSYRQQVALERYITVHVEYDSGKTVVIIDLIHFDTGVGLSQ